MLFVFSGSDVVAVREKAHAFLHTHEKRGVSVAHVTAEACTEDALASLAGGASLFGDEQVILLDTPSESKESFAAVVSSAELLATSAHTFVLIEGKLLAKESQKLKKHAREYHEVVTGTKKERFNIFSLTEALLRRDKKSLWVLLMRARLAGISSEEIIGTLFWQVKTMRLVLSTSSAREAGVKPFVYTKAQKGLTKYSEEEVHNLSRVLIDVYHTGHLGADIDNTLERWVLSL